MEGLLPQGFRALGEFSCLASSTTCSTTSEHNWGQFACSGRAGRRRIGGSRAREAVDPVILGAQQLGCRDDRRESEVRGSPAHPWSSRRNSPGPPVGNPSRGEGVRVPRIQSSAPRSRSSTPRPRAQVVVASQRHAFISSDANGHASGGKGSGGGPVAASLLRWKSSNAVHVSYHMV